MLIGFLTGISFYVLYLVHTFVYTTLFTYIWVLQKANDTVMSKKFEMIRQPTFTLYPNFVTALL